MSSQGSSSVSRAWRRSPQAWSGLYGANPTSTCSLASLRSFPLGTQLGPVYRARRIAHVGGLPAGQWPDQARLAEPPPCEHLPRAAISRKALATHDGLG